MTKTERQMVLVTWRIIAYVLYHLTKGHLDDAARELGVLDRQIDRWEQLDVPIKRN